ncbi:MAG: hypothetical protein M1292_07105 [Bacteroidetes bacterium]|nr:hypothetical protein [Bacteroidota bacterium]
MGKENFIQNKIAVGALILVALAATIIPAYLLLNTSGVKYLEFVNFLGINLVLIVAGSIFLAFALIKQWNICIDYANKQADKRTEYDQMTKQGMQLNGDLLKWNVIK